MDSINRLYIELLVSAINQGGYLDRTISINVFQYYLELVGEKEKITESLRDNYRFMKSKSYEDLQNLEEREKEFDEKIQAFQDSLSKINSSKTEDIKLTDNEKKDISPAYRFYRSKTGQKRNMPLELHRLNQESLQRIEKMIKQIGRDSIELGIWKEIDNQLQFSDEYIPLGEEIKPIKKVADACSKVYMADTDISREDLVNKVLSEYYIEKYDDKSAKETKRLTKKAVKQWVRYHKDYEIN